MNEELKDFLYEHKETILKNDFDKLYTEIVSLYIGTTASAKVGELTKFLLEDCNIDIWEHLPSLHINMFNAYKGKTIVIPDKYFIIPLFCFAYSDVHEIKLPDTTDNISPYAFTGLSCNILKIPKKCEFIGVDTFKTVENIGELYISEYTYNKLHEETKKDIDESPGIQLKMY